MKSIKKLFGIFCKETETMKEAVNVSDVSNETSKTESQEVNGETTEKFEETCSAQKAGGHQLLLRIKSTICLL